MLIGFHKRATMIPAIRDCISVCGKSVKTLVREPNFNVTTMCERRQQEYRQHTWHRPRQTPRTTLGTVRGELMLDVRRTLLLAFDEFTEITFARIHPEASDLLMERSVCWVSFHINSYRSTHAAKGLLKVLSAMASYRLVERLTGNWPGFFTDFCLIRSKLAFVIRLLGCNCHGSAIEYRLSTALHPHKSASSRQACAGLREDASRGLSLTRLSSPIASGRVNRLSVGVVDWLRRPGCPRQLVPPNKGIGAWLLG